MLDVESIVIMLTSFSSAWRVGSSMRKCISVANVLRHTPLPNIATGTRVQKSDAQDCNFQARKGWSSETQTTNRCSKFNRWGSFGQARMIMSDPHNPKPKRSQQRKGIPSRTSPRVLDIVSLIACSADAPPAAFLALGQKGRNLPDEDQAIQP